VALHKSHLDDPLEVLRRLGGREIAAMAGAILAARMERIPVLIDGYVATAAAAVLHAANPSALDHCLIGHVSAEPGAWRRSKSSARRRCWRLACGWARGPGRRSPQVSSSRLRSAIPAWQPSPRPVSAGKE
jgi:nicotinate-nucleotide--dimethylbenzimidazole phosphoribosyltransferase